MHTIQGGLRLAFDSVAGVTNAVEGVHKSIARGPIAASVYAIIRGVNGALRQGVDRSLALLPGSMVANHTGSAAELRAIAALNGAFGDHLEATANPLAIPMTLLCDSTVLCLEPEALAAAIPRPASHVALMVHGLGMSELGWSRAGAPALGSSLQQALGCTPLYLRYNSGRNVSCNGRELAALLDALFRAWPVPLESLSLVGHSMGGLVIRSACWYAEQAKMPWLPALRRIVCLGTPHHGAPLERAGHALDLMLQQTRFTRPLALGKYRSAGIKDLRFGNLLDEDWEGWHPDRPGRDRRRAVPLMPSVDYYFVAATLGAHLRHPLGVLLGDMLVRTDSAVGYHKDTSRCLEVNPEHCKVFHERNHFALLSDPRVHQQLIQWWTKGGSRVAT
ncbi:alpha/beta fold hydrolase [Haliea sp. E1-2-M8]|uniref:esterase/lipase family protein n=1 Tax=Haliea sp. E1-2-M8 TaxID=3064706 RepID=UPI0027289B91|nr:alpha/beta fold hydrolase [Haliea sp. E1-2-M8]MDO8862916.1 alpha/beta fold hydrolase [Haliea sp. E1-2-M8]